MAPHPLDDLFTEIKSRKGTDPAKSYTAKLLKGGPPKIAKKLGEEAVEAVIASLVEDKEHFVAECADVLYHLLVLVASRDATLKDVYGELIKRRGQSGLDEKASRKTKPVKAVKAVKPVKIAKPAKPEKAAARAAA